MRARMYAWLQGSCCRRRRYRVRPLNLDLFKQSIFVGNDEFSQDSSDTNQNLTSHSKGVCADIAQAGSPDEHLQLTKVQHDKLNTKQLFGVAFKSLSRSVEVTLEKFNKADNSIIQRSFDSFSFEYRASGGEVFDDEKEGEEEEEKRLGKN